MFSTTQRTRERRRSRCPTGSGCQDAAEAEDEERHPVRYGGVAGDGDSGALTPNDLRAVGFLRGVATRPEPGQHGKPARRRLSRDPAERSRSGPCRSVGCLDSIAARMAMPAARVGVYLSGPDGIAHLAGYRPVYSRSHGLSRAVAAVVGNADLSRRPSASRRLRAVHVDGVFNGGLGRRHPENHDDSYQRGPMRRTCESLYLTRRNTVHLQ
jgi:hypothetical protein